MYAASITGYDRTRAGRINSGLSIVALRIIPGSFASIGRAPEAGRCVFSGETSGRIFRAALKFAPGRISGRAIRGESFFSQEGRGDAFTPLYISSFSLSPTLRLLH